ncbi:MAG: 2-oxoacid:acceptor oxidoreductase family protein [Dehalococcoidales bacterium]|nr:2-oxoacid:acceptor oxidoreductase family protein [Dehalococcoidales bacterium]
MKREEIILGGFGGQGIILAGSIVGKAAAIFNGQNSTLTQDYGPEARGGACRAQVVVSDSPVSYPYVENPSVLVVMSQEAYEKYAAGAKQDVPLLIDEDLVKLKKDEKHPVFPIPATRFARELGREAVANIVMVGFLAAISSIVPAEAMKKSVLSSVPKGTEELNTKAFERGYNYGKEQLAAGKR